MFLSKIVTLNILLSSNCHFEVLLNYIVPFYRIFVVFFVMCPIIVTICGIWQFYLHGGLLLYFTDFCFVDCLIYQSNQLTVTLTFLCVLFCYNLRTKTSRAPNPKKKTLIYNSIFVYRYITRMAGRYAPFLQVPLSYCNPNTCIYQP